MAPHSTWGWRTVSDAALTGLFPNTSSLRGYYRRELGTIAVALLTPVQQKNEKIDPKAGNSFRVLYALGRQLGTNKRNKLFRTLRPTTA